jgi:predicted nucleic acid-binding protein
MTTATNSNILVALWNEDDALNTLARKALDELASPSRGEAFLDAFFRDTGMSVDWELGETIWRTAGRAFQRYVMRRAKQPGSGPRRILADFLIGAHALQNGFRLLTLDDRLYAAAFPRLAIYTI